MQEIAKQQNDHDTLGDLDEHKRERDGYNAIEKNKNDQTSERNGLKKNTTPTKKGIIQD